MKLSLLLLLFVIPLRLAAQGHHMQMSHSMPMMEQKQPTLQLRGSGTAWLPEAAPHHAHMWHSKNWMYMLHGNIFARYTNQDAEGAGTRGDERFGSVNWFMGMAQTRIGDRGLLNFTAMISLEPLTVGGAGYPLLFQTGETWHGKPLVDHQHPHDLFSELSVSYKQAFSNNLAGYIYVGYPGEPALGPVTFMHRPSGVYIPNTPLSHHWQDATHITFGVATAGLQYKNWKLETSVFTGTEPNEDRYDFDKPRFNSQSVRLSFNPSRNWALQVSRGRLNDVHGTGPREDLSRTTASAIYARSWGESNYLNAAAVWGFNNPREDHHPNSNSFLLEGALTLHKSTIYGRYEFVQKTAGALLLPPATYPADELYPVQALSFGFQQIVYHGWDTNLSLGLQGRLYFTPNEIVPVYGETPIGVQAYLRIYPGMNAH